MTGLYVHIPFCVKKCHYCDFVVTPAGAGPKRAAFLSALGAECALWRRVFENAAFDTLYVGGGTPSALDLAETQTLFRTLRENFRFQDGAEISYEANPGDFSAKRRALPALLKNLGVSRISLGAQSFSEATLRRLNRAHGAAEILKSFEILRKAGFQNINLDLILSLPGESLEDVRHSLESAAGLGPEHISLYELVIEEKTVFGRAHRRGALDLPDEGSQLEMLSFAARYLEERGYRRYELLNYSKPGFESRHNRLYWANEEYLGLGPGAFSYLGGRRFRRAASFGEYMTKMENADPQLCEEEILSPEEKEIESFLLALRRAEGAEIPRFKRLFPRISGGLRRLEGEGLVIQEEQSVRLTPRGRLFAETVFAELC